MISNINNSYKEDGDGDSMMCIEELDAKTNDKSNQAMNLDHLHLFTSSIKSPTAATSHTDAELYSDESEFRCEFKLEAEEMEEIVIYPSCVTNDHSIELSDQNSRSTRKIGAKRRYFDEESSTNHDDDNDKVAYVSNISNETSEFKCNECAFSSNTNINLQCHLRCHTGNRPLKCEFCSASYIRKDHLQNHMINYHSRSNDVHRENDDAPIEASNKSETSSEDTVNNQKKAFYKTGSRMQAIRNQTKCNICNKFVQTIERHMQLHSDARPFKCNQCDHRSKLKFDLKRHMQRIHTGEKPYNCNKCGSRFLTKYELECHTFVHVGNRPHKKNHMMNIHSESSNDVHRENADSAIAASNNSTETSLKEISNTDDESNENVDIQEKADNKACSKIQVIENRTKCNICNKFVQTIERHMQLHSDERPFKCNQCDYRAKRTDHLKKHIQRNHTVIGEKLYKCRECGSRFSTKYELKRHSVVNVGNRLHKKEDSQNNTIDTHSRSNNDVHRENAESAIAALNNSTVVTNQSETSLEEISNTDYESKENAKEITVNIQEEADNKDYSKTQVIEDGTKCNICNKFVKYIKRHMRTHSDERPFECNQCEYRSNRKDHLMSHIKRMHTGENKRHKCNECGSLFVTKYELKSHSIVHVGNRPHKCNHCSASYKTVKRLVLHMAGHKKEITQKQKMCLQPPQLNKVLDIKSKKTEIRSKKRCHICKKFIINLTQHIKTHTNKRPFKCDQCGFKFKQRNHLKRHLNLHSSTRQHKCNICPAAYYRLDSYRKHLSTHFD